MDYLRSDAEIALDGLNARNAGTLPGHLGMIVTSLTRRGAEGYIDIEAHHMAPNGFLHAGTLVTLADSLCGVACAASLPASAAGFTTIELKSNFFGTARSGRITGTAAPLHLGGTTQVWDSEIIHADTGKRLAQFRCTQMVLRPR